MDLSGIIFKKDPDKTFILNYAPLFSGLDFFHKNLIAQKSKIVEYKKGDIIYHQFDPPGPFYCVVSGRVKIYSQTQKHKALKHGESLKQDEVIEYLNCGKYFGVISLLTGDAHSVSAEALNDCKILVIARDDFHNILEKVPKLAIDVSKTLSRRLRSKDLGIKKIFESNIISMLSMGPSVSNCLYPQNFALSLRKETNKKVILINVAREYAGGQNTQEPSLVLERHISKNDTIENAIIKNGAIDVLNIQYGPVSANLSGINFILTYLTGNYHYIIVNLLSSIEEARERPAQEETFPQADEVVSLALKQSDMVQIITDYDKLNLKKTGELASALYELAHFAKDKVKIILNGTDKKGGLPREELNGFLKYGVYAVLPKIGGLKEDDKPDIEFSRAVRRISREIGDNRIGLALGAGAAFGLAHIGVIKILEKENIPIDVVSGSSIGALIGAFWAAGYSGEEIEEIFVKYNDDTKKTFFMLGDIHMPKTSIMKGERIRSFLERHLGKKTFYDIKFPFKIVASNLTKRRPYIFNSGMMVDAVMASIAIPGILEPSYIDGDLIVDAGVLEPVPVGTLVNMGLKKIFAVNVLPGPQDIMRNYEYKNALLSMQRGKAQVSGIVSEAIFKSKKRIRDFFFPNILDIIVNSMQAMEYGVADSDSQKADVIINPIDNRVEWFEFFKVKQLIQKGQEETEKMLALLKSVIAQ